MVPALPSFQRGLIVTLVILAIILLVQPATQPPADADNQAIDFYYLPTCQHCAAQKLFHTELLAKYPNLTIASHDVTGPTESSKLSATAQRFGIEVKGVPFTVIGDHYVVGFEGEASAREIEEAVQVFLGLKGGLPRDGVDGSGPGGNASTGATCTLGNGSCAITSQTIALPFFGAIDVAAVSLPLLAVVLGLVDGFNPCAMWVLVYLISLILTLNDRKKMWLLVGSFVLASGILYFLFMTAWLNVFLLLGYFRPLTIVVGLGALGVGLNDLNAFRKKGALVCAVGGPSKKKTLHRIEQIVRSPLTLTTVIGIIALAFVVNSIEFVCSSALPVIFTHILALAGLPVWLHYGYIALYVLFFMLDDLIIFSLAAMAVTTATGQKYAKYCKLIGGIVLVAIGILLAFAPHLLGYGAAV